MQRPSPTWVSTRSLRALILIGWVALLMIKPCIALDKSGVSPSKISLPTGPGSIDGLGESFEAQLNTGTFTYSIPIELPKIRGDSGPSLSLSYNSGNGNGPCGMGWKLEVPRLQRQTDKGLPQYVGGDTIIDSTGEELVKLADGAYRSENEGKSVRFERLPNDSWLARLPNGSVMALGATANSRLAGPSGTFSWQISSLTDTNGNITSYTYQQDGGQIYLASVTVGQHTSLPSETFTASFTYQTGRSDLIVDYRPGFRSETRLRLTGILISHGARRLAQYNVSYDSTEKVSLLKSITMFGDDRSKVGSDALANVDFLPPHHFDYSLPTFAQNWRMVTVTNTPAFSFAANQMEFTDVDGDSLPDLVIYDQSDAKYLTALNKGEGNPWGNAQVVQNAPNSPLNNQGTQFADLRGDGKSRLLVEDDTSFNFRNFESATRFGNATPFVIPGGFEFTNPDVRFIDINNDKAMDIIYTDGFGNGHFDFLINRQTSGQANYILPNPPAPPNGGIAFSTGFQLSDVNGDRLTDLVKPGTQEQGGCVFYYSQGWGKFTSQQIMANGPQESDLGSRGLAGLSSLDVNQDGWTDCVYVDSGIVKIWINQSGTSFSPPVTISGPQIPDYEEGVTGIRFADMNGNGSTDIVWNRTDGTTAQRLQYLELSPGTKPHLLTTATNELGGSISIEYKSSVDYMVVADGTPQQWTTVCPISIPVVSALVENDGRGHDYRSEITYRNAYYDGSEKEFRGFEFATRKEIGNAAQGSPTLATEMQFNTGNMVEALKGKPLAVEERDDTTGAIFSRITHRWVPRQLALALDPAETRKVTLAYEDFEETTILEGGPTSQAVTLQREFNVDDYGNTIRSADYGRVEGSNHSAWDDERITYTTYSAAYPSGLSTWLLDAPIQTEVQDENGTVIARTRNFYDDPTFGGGNLGLVTKGNLTLERRWSDIAGNKYLAASRSVFDGYGNVSGIYDPLGTPGNLTPGHYRSFIYDTKIHTYPETETVQTGNPSQPTLSATATYDVGLGVLKSFTDFNTQTTTLLYDTFGRLTDMIRPGDTLTAPTASYTYFLSQTHPSGILNYIESHRRETAGGGTIDSRDYFDGLGRKLQSRSESEQGTSAVVTGATEFNQRKSAWKSYLPYFSAGGLAFSTTPSVNAFTETTYDALGRSLRTFQPPAPISGYRAFSENSYEPLALLLKDEEQTKSASPHFGAASRQVFDGLKSSDGKSRLREVQEIVKISDTGEVAGTPFSWRTQYRYDLLDNLIHITDSQNNVKTLAFDALSRMTGMDDPDAGLLSLLYDDASNLKQSTDANGHVIVYDYDGANRPITEDYLDAANLSPDVHYIYDVPTAALDQGDGTTATAQNTKGRLASVQDLSGEEHLSYDARGRTISEVKRLPDPQLGLLVSYRTQSSFDSADRLNRLTYPDGDYVEYRYNARSLLEKITGGPSGFLISAITYRAIRVSLSH
jgi:YD repeat-containing protein